MTKTTRRERRKRAIASGAAESRGVSKVKSAGLKHNSKARSTGLVVTKGGKHLVKRPAAARKQKKKGDGEATPKPPPGRGAGGRKKKRPRSQVDEDASGEEDDGGAQPLVADELMATIQEHDEFFSRMLDMIPEHLVLPAKEVTESSYASKYMKARR